MTALTGKPLEPRRRTPPRPYARQRKWGPSVTTVLGMMDKPGLSWGAAKETALFAVHHQDEWKDLPVDEAVDRLRRHHRGVWDGRAAVGTAVHAINEAWTWGEDAEVPPETELYVDGLERFWNDFRPVTIATEEVVRHVHPDNGYIGQRDWVADLAGLGRTQIDLKTTAQQDTEKGLYWDSWRLQLAAYRFAEELVEYDAEGKEVAAHPAYPIDSCAILHLRGDGDYRLYRCDAGEAEWQRFMLLRGVWTWVNKEAKTKAERVSAPTEEAGV